MIILIQRICIALSGLGIPMSVARAISDSAAIEVDSWKRTKLRML